MMNLSTKGLLQAAVLSTLMLSLHAHADWAQSADPLIIQPGPVDTQVQAQNPPGFTWARHPTGPASYELEITQAGVSLPTRVTVDRNWYLPAKAMALGDYSWRVRPAGSTDWSSPRTFSLTARATVFEVPDNAALRARILAKARPRSLPASFSPLASWNAAKKAALEPFSSRMYNEVKLQIGALPPLSDARWSLSMVGPLNAAMATQQTDVRQRINEASRQLEAAAVMWRVRARFGHAGRGAAQGRPAGRPRPQGPHQLCQPGPGHAPDRPVADQGNRHPGSRPGCRTQGPLAGCRQRTHRGNYDDLAGGNGRLDQFPFDSHGNTSLVFLVLISSLSLGDLPDAQKWFDFSFRAYANSPSPWSGPEGGYANGTAYAEYAAGYLVALWDPLSQVTGVNFYAKPWALGFLDFAIEFTPPGARTHVFGDGSETRPDPRVFAAFASRMVSPRAAWYVSKLGGLEDALSMLQAPYPLPVAGTRTLAPPSNSAYYPSIGWTAMHSDIGSTERTSVYFKSSPYGSFNHSHGDQNGLLISAAGQPLLVKAGWYDWYGSPLWTDWYHQTRAQNAITFDGGKGQMVDGYREQLQHNGRITAFAAPAAYDYAEGDATPSYGGQLSMARRQVWYLHGTDSVLVRDRLSATVPHTYEFNLHTPAGIVAEATGAVKVAVNNQSLCVRSLRPDAVFEKRTWPAPKAGVIEDHGAFTVKNDGKAPAEFLMLLDVGCKRPAVNIATAASGVRTVTVGTQTIVIN